MRGDRSGEDKTGTARLRGPGIAPTRRPTGLVHVPQEYIALIEGQRAEVSEGSIMIRIGISDNTWRKIRTGQPIRASVAHRLIDRIMDRRDSAER